MELDIIKSLEEYHDFSKSWSVELQKKYPSGRWVTIRGAKIFVDSGGKIVAGNKDLRRKLEGTGKKVGDKIEGEGVNIKGKETIKGKMLYGGTVDYKGSGVQIPFNYDTEESALKRAKEIYSQLKSGEYKGKRFTVLTSKETLQAAKKEHKEKKGGDLLKQRTDKLLKQYYEKDKEVKVKVVKRGVAESTAKIDAKKRGGNFRVEPDENERGKFKVVHDVKGDAEGLTLKQYSDKYRDQLEITAKSQLEYEGKLNKGLEPDIIKALDNDI